MINKNNTTPFWYNPLTTPQMVVSGFLENDQYLRVMASHFEQIASENQSLRPLMAQTSGGMIRFTTDSTRLFIDARLGPNTSSNNLTFSVKNSFDIYLKDFKTNQYRYLNVTKADFTNNYVKDELFNDIVGLKEVLINFPLFNEVTKLLIGLDEGSLLLEPTPFQTDKKIVFYGTSITQGASSSRPGNNYVNTVSRILNREVINLGFSGNGLGEPSMIEMISRIKDMEMFIIDYDANAGAAGTLYTTLEPLILAVRKNNPELPIIVISRIYYVLENTHKTVKKAMAKRRKYQKEIVMKANDPHLYYVDGRKLLPKHPEDCFSDDIHLNDLGFYYFSKNIIKIIDEILTKER